MRNSRMRDQARAGRVINRMRGPLLHRVLRRKKKASSEPSIPAFLLLENGSRLLLESGGGLMLEQ